MITAGIPSVYIMLSLIDKQDLYSASKYKCTNEQKAKKVSVILYINIYIYAFLPDVICVSLQL